MTRWLIAGGSVAVLVGVGFICPAVALWKDQGELPLVSMLLLLWGALLTLSGVGVVVYGVRGVRA